MDAKFLKELQDSGWHIEHVSEESAICKCPSVGCGLRAKLTQGAHIPKVDPGHRRDLLDHPISQYDDIRRILRERREGLGLTIREVEEVSGMAGDHLAKAEKDDFVKVPNANVMIEWAQSLGFEVVLRPSGLPTYTRRVVAESRKSQASRQRRFSLERRRRGSR